jgi:pimeloyl-ACP methyl ester carboxylesterase
LLPVLVIHGEDDRLVPVAVGHELARRAPNARLVLVPGGRHMLPVTHAELLAAEIANVPTPR